MSKFKTILKLDSVEVTQSDRGTISFETNDKTGAMWDLFGKVQQLEQELVLSTDQNDLLLDEFIRVKHLTDNSEIHGLCERAHVRMRQNVSVIERNYKMESKIAELEQEVKELKTELEDTYALYEHGDIYIDGKTLAQHDKEVYRRGFTDGCLKAIDFEKSERHLSVSDWDIGKIEDLIQEQE